MRNSAKSIFGKAGEDFAAKYLAETGYIVLGRNIRQRFGELDIVAKSKDDCLVFVEVKTMRGGDIKPEDQMTQAKLHKFRQMAEFFANSHPELINEKSGWRIDVLALTKIEKEFVIKHYKNVT